LINDGAGGGIVGVIASLGDGSTTGYYSDALGNLNTFVGTQDENGSFTGLLSAGGKAFDLVNAGAAELLTNLTQEGTGKIP
jgi:hypothetical protein